MVFHICQVFARCLTWLFNEVHTAEAKALLLGLRYEISVFHNFSCYHGFFFGLLVDIYFVHVRGKFKRVGFI